MCEPVPGFEVPICFCQTEARANEQVLAGTVLSDSPIRLAGSYGWRIGLGVTPPTCDEPDSLPHVCVREVGAV